MNVSKKTSVASIAPLLWDAHTTANAMGISTRKLWSMTASGEIPSVKLGRLVRYQPASVAAVLANLERSGNSAE